MAKSKTRRCNSAEQLETTKDMAANLEAALEDGEPAVMVQALGPIACARGMPLIARGMGLEKGSLYEPLSPEGNPEFATVLKVAHTLGLKPHAEPHRQPDSNHLRPSASRLSGSF